MVATYTDRPPRRLRELVRLRPRTPWELGVFCDRVLGLKMPGLVGDRAGDRVGDGVGGELRGPGAYLAHSYFETGGSRDCVVWANRGGGKTMLGAVATVLDLLFKPGVQVRVLGGSLEQSRKMYEHMTALLDRPALRGGGGVLAGEPTQREVRLANGSRVALLAGSQRSVRGVRVQKLRCDEVEELDPEVWEAAQMVTRSAVCGDEYVRGGIEALSTMHRAFGLMSDLVGGASTHAIPDASLAGLGSASALVVPSGRKVFRWNAMDVIARCEPERACETCVLWADCGGMAKSADGFIPVADLVDQRARTGDRAWESEMLCRRPSVSDVVYPEFEIQRHVGEMMFDSSQFGFDNPNQKSRISSFKSEISDSRSVTRNIKALPLWIGGVDFGMRSPFVFLWAVVEPFGTRREAERARVHVVGEYAASGRTLGEHVRRVGELVEAEGWPGAAGMAWVGVDPAGGQRNSHSGQSDVRVLREAGYRVRATRSRVVEGLKLVRRRLDRGTLMIHPRCTGLIEAMQKYHFDPARREVEEPVKDGPDHLCDALRYMLVNLEMGGGEVEGGSYL